VADWDGGQEDGDARACERLGDNAGVTVAELLAPGERDEVGAFFVGDRNDLVGGHDVAEEPDVVGAESGGGV
jgi:hypothetical protein